MNLKKPVKSEKEDVVKAIDEIIEYLKENSQFLLHWTGMKISDLHKLSLGELTDLEQLVDCLGDHFDPNDYSTEIYDFCFI